MNTAHTFTNKYKKYINGLWINVGFSLLEGMRVVPPHPTNQKFAHPLSGKISPSGHPLTNQSLIPPLNNNFNVIIR